MTRLGRKGRRWSNWSFGSFFARDAGLYLGKSPSGDEARFPILGTSLPEVSGACVEIAVTEHGNSRKGEKGRSVGRKEGRVKGSRDRPTPRGGTKEIILT